MITARDDRRRTFETVPAGVEAVTWWGRAWVAALEARAHDAARLARGRTYATEGHVEAVTVTPGRIVAYVRGSRARPYRTELSLAAFADDAWAELLEAVAADPSALATLLEREVPQSLAQTILPGAGELVPRCSCPDTARPPCKHAAALCYRAARLLDQDPFVLLLLRGRGERELLDELARRNAAHAAREQPDTAPDFPGVPARAAVARAVLPPLPAPLAPPPAAGLPPAYPADPGAPDPLALDQLATDAAARALAMLTTGADPTGHLTLWQDAVRLASAHHTAGLTGPARGLYRDLARATGRSTTELARAAAAWRQGGLPALTVLDEPWDPPAGPFDRARPALLAAGLGAFRPERNRLTDRTRQLRLSREGLWYAYESRADDEDWWPAAAPSPDPVTALSR
ncbi:MULTISPECIES: SWIM zinc finger family protein [unclassified Streptomyces]|uniref:SWIM zinc finger family protein n=1 Tax=unclassified Streptomyces TaxID=2593676 RepID=UPI0029A7A920|nr:SWIM zinc finger family protein [Streptomyces sp. DK15]MDX2394687.1 SWIM zinc finger family protein [Streptomyces sp. DK15]